MSLLGIDGQLVDQLCFCAAIACWSESTNVWNIEVYALPRLGFFSQQFPCFFCLPLVIFVGKFSNDRFQDCAGLLICEAAILIFNVHQRIESYDPLCVGFQIGHSFTFATLDHLDQACLGEVLLAVVGSICESVRNCQV